MSTTGGRAVADPLAVEEHRRFVLLPLADHDRAVHRDRVEDEAHRVDGCAVGGELVAAADPAGGGQSGGLGDPDQLQSQVAVGLRLRWAVSAIGGGGYRVRAVESRWGLTLPLPGITLAEHEEHVQRAEALGYTDFWSGETAGPDGFTPLALAAAWTERARLGTGIVGVFQRGPALLAQEAAALASASDGRFVLGIGASSDRIVEGWNGIPFEKPLAKVRETLELPADGAGRRAHRDPLQAGKPTGRTKVPIVLAALRGKMLELAVERADGAFTNFLPLGGLPQVVGPARRRPDGLRAALPLLLHPRRARAGRAGGALHVLLLHHGPGLRGFYRWLGYGEQIDPMVEAWEAGDRKAAAAAAPWELIEDMFIFGSPEQMKERLHEFVAGGVTLPVVTPIVGPEKLGEAIEALAPWPRSAPARARPAGRRCRGGGSRAAGRARASRDAGRGRGRRRGPPGASRGAWARTRP